MHTLAHTHTNILTLDNFLLSKLLEAHILFESDINIDSAHVMQTWNTSEPLKVSIKMYATLFCLEIFSSPQVSMPGIYTLHAQL